MDSLLVYVLWDLNKSLLTYSHHYNVMCSVFTPLKVLCAPPTHLVLSWAACGEGGGWLLIYPHPRGNLFNFSVSQDL